MTKAFTVAPIGAAIILVNGLVMQALVFASIYFGSYVAAAVCSLAVAAWLTIIGMTEPAF